MSLRERLGTWLIGGHRRPEQAAAAPEKTRRFEASELIAALNALSKENEDRYKYPLKMPVLPKATHGEVKLGMDDGNWGGFPGPNWQGFLAGPAAGFALYFPGYQILSEIAQRTEYRQPAETLSKDLTRKWVEFKSTGGDDKSARIKELKEACEHYKLQQHYRQMAMLDAQFGIGMLQPKIKDQLRRDQRGEPLVAIDRDALIGFANIEPIWITPTIWNAVDPIEADFYKPTKWTVLGTNTDSTRLLRFVSREVPDIIKPAYNFGGISLSQLIMPYVDRWLSTVTAVNKLISNFSIINVQTNMSQILQGKEDNGFIERMKLFVSSRNNQGLFLTDKEREGIMQINVPITGLDQLQAQAQEHMAMPTHIPLIVLTGLTPAGLNRSDQGEIEVYHDWCHSVQESLFTDNLDRSLDLIEMSLWGKPDPEITYDYVPLKEVTVEQAARMRKDAADAGVAYINAGVIAPIEERARLAEDPDSGYLNLTVENVPDPPQLEDGGEPGADGEGKDDDDPPED